MQERILKPVTRTESRHEEYGGTKIIRKKSVLVEEGKEAEDYWNQLKDRDSKDCYKPVKEGEDYNNLKTYFTYTDSTSASAIYKHNSGSDTNECTFRIYFFAEMKDDIGERITFKILSKSPEDEFLPLKMAFRKYLEEQFKKEKIKFDEELKDFILYQWENLKEWNNNPK